MESMDSDFKEMMQKDIDETKKTREDYISKSRTKYILFELALGLVGWGLLIYSLGWLISLSILLIMSGNNMLIGRNVYKKYKNITKMLWENE